MGKPGERRVPEHECILRLKRWFIMGAEPRVVEQFEEGLERTLRCVLARGTEVQVPHQHSALLAGVGQ